MIPPNDDCCEPHYMLLSLPSCGTDWLAKAVVDANPKLRYYREFFNPICNLERYDQLHGLGCELSHTAHQIAVPSMHCWSQLRLSHKCWLDSGFTFTKETFLPFKVGFFAERFRCFALYRPYRGLFPPSRLRVVSWYNTIFWALQGNYLKLADTAVGEAIWLAIRHARTVPQRCVAAHVISMQQLAHECLEHKIGIVLYPQLISGTGAQILRHLRSAMPADLDHTEIASQLELSRDMRRVPRDKKHQHLWEPAFEMAERFLLDACPLVKSLEAMASAA